MIAVCPNKKCNQRYRIKPEMIGRIAKCKKCNNPFKIEELISPPKPLELKPIETAEAVAQPRGTPEGKAQPDSKAQQPRQQESVSKGLRRRHRKSGGVRKPLLYITSSLLVVGLIAIAASLFIGNFHIISGSNTGISVVRRNSFGIREFFINANRISGMPTVSAKKQFPVGFKVLQREGIIKPDGAVKKPIDTEERREFNKAVRDAQQEIDKMMRDAQNAVKNPN
jgi:hypothetical protein